MNVFCLSRTYSGKVFNYLAKSSGVMGFGYACSINSKTFSAVSGTASYCESSNETIFMKNMKLRQKFDKLKMTKKNFLITSLTQCN